MSAQPWVTGPGHIFAGVGAGKAPVYFGTAEATPRIDIRPAFTPYFNSLYSSKLPMDQVFDGEEIVISGDFTRWDEAVLAAMQALRASTTAAFRGAVPAGGYGTMQVFESFCYPLWVQFPYAAKAAYSNMPAGYRVYNAILIGPDGVEPIGPTPSKRRLTWWGAPTLTVGAFNTTAGATYDHVMSGLPSVN